MGFPLSVIHFLLELSSMCYGEIAQQTNVPNNGII